MLFGVGKFKIIRGIVLHAALRACVLGKKVRDMITSRTLLVRYLIFFECWQGSTGGSLGSSIDISNRGQIRFYRKSPAACSVKLTISYEVRSNLAFLSFNEMKEACTSTSFL